MTDIIMTQMDLTASAMTVAGTPAQATAETTAPDRGPTEESVAAILRMVGLRPTRQRTSLGSLLFDGQDKHVTAELLHEQAVDAGVKVSLATVYNTLHQFIGAGLLREVAVDGAKSYFDTNTRDHHHFFVEGESRLFDIEDGNLSVNGIPAPPDGHEIAHVDVVIRLRRKA
jgi:Fur family iron response transcriptional regulator